MDTLRVLCGGGGAGRFRYRSVTRRVGTFFAPTPVFGTEFQATRQIPACFLYDR